jgi:hypothetical protein
LIENMDLSKEQAQDYIVGARCPNPTPGMWFFSSGAIIMIAMPNHRLDRRFCGCSLSPCTYMQCDNVSVTWTTMPNSTWFDFCVVNSHIYKSMNCQLNWVRANQGLHTIAILLFNCWSDYYFWFGLLSTAEFWLFLACTFWFFDWNMWLHTTRDIWPEHTAAFWSAYLKNSRCISKMIISWGGSVSGCFAF